VRSTRKLGFEPAPILMWFILGPMLEENLRRALVLSRGDPGVFLREPISAIFLACAAMAILATLLPAFRRVRETLKD
jgi:putative tricarboxylic transport membrane protein